MHDISFKFIFILKKIIWCRAPTKAQFVSEWINFINSIIWNYENKFTPILKHFKNEENVKKTCRRENGNPFYWKTDFWNLRKMLRMGKFEKLKLFENWIRKFIFKVKRKELGRMTRGPKICMPMQRKFPSEFVWKTKSTSEFVASQQSLTHPVQFITKNSSLWPNTFIRPSQSIFTLA